MKFISHANKGKVMSDNVRFISCNPIGQNRFVVTKCFDGGTRIVKVIKLAGDPETAIQRAKQMGFITQEVPEFEKNGPGLCWGNPCAVVSPAEPEDDDCMYVAIATLNDQYRCYGPFMTRNNAEQFVATVPSEWKMQIAPLLLAELPVS